jgi:hypothetical protein
MLTKSQPTRLVAHALFATTISLAMLSSSAAHAVTNIIDASLCHGVSHRDEQYLARYSGTIEYLPSGTNYPDAVQLVCPVTRTTSGPGITNDYLTSVTMTGYSGFATCTLSEYGTDISGITNVLGESEASGSGYYYTLPMYGNNSGYWGTSTAWRFAEVHCTLGQYATLQQYTVVEAGSVQSRRRISSAAACIQTPESDSYAFYQGAAHIPYTSPDPAQVGGFVEAPGGHPGFDMSCPIPVGSGSYVQVALGPAVGTGHQIGCHKAGTSTFTWLPSSNTEWITKTLVFGNTGSLICAIKDDADDGDGKVISYRTANSKTF